MAVNIVLMKESKKLLDLSKQLGFSKTLFLDKDLVLVKGSNKKDILKATREGKKKGSLVAVRIESEEILRFVLEKTEADLVFGQELMISKDSVHFRRGGLDQVVCKIAAKRGKTIGFSFRDLLISEDKSKLMGRMMFNLKLCKKYRVKVVFSNFSENEWELRGKQELDSFKRLLGC